MTPCSLGRSVSRSLPAGIACLLLSVVVLDCTVTPLGASDEGMAKARAAAAPGGEDYERECASCHGRRGEGLASAPAVMGVGALPTFARDDASSSSSTFTTSGQVQGGDTARVPGQPKRGPFRTARDLYDYVSSRMPLPKSRAGTLPPAENWAIVNYLLVANGTSVPAGGVSEASAASVPLR